jgi:hypothetical protein
MWIVFARNLVKRELLLLTRNTYLHSFLNGGSNTSRQHNAPNWSVNVMEPESRRLAVEIIETRRTGQWNFSYQRMNFRRCVKAPLHADTVPCAECIWEPKTAGSYSIEASLLTLTACTRSVAGSTLAVTRFSFPEMERRLSREGIWCAEIQSAHRVLPCAKPGQADQVKNKK